MTEPAYADEASRRLDRPFERIQEDLEELLDLPWEEVEVVIETSADKGDRSRADVVVDLVGRATVKPTFSARMRRSVVRWIGKPWRERTNPWEKHKHRLPDRPPPTEPTQGDLDEWSPLKEEE